MTFRPPQRPRGPRPTPPRPPGMTPPRPPGIAPPRPPASPGQSTTPSARPASAPIPASRVPSAPGRPGSAGTSAGQFGAGRYAPKLQKAPPKPKQKILSNLVFRTVFFVGFAMTSFVLGPNYKINGPEISFGLIALMALGVVMIDWVLWKCPSCGRYLGILPWPGKRCKKCQVRFF